MDNNEDLTDDFLDSLPAHQRKKVMGVLFADDQPESTPEGVQSTFKVNPLKVVLALMLGLPIAAIGLFCIATIILAPVGFVLVGLSGYPLYRVFNWGINDSISR